MYRLVAECEDACAREQARQIARVRERDDQILELEQSLRESAAAQATLADENRILMDDCSRLLAEVEAHAEDKNEQETALRAEIKAL